MLGETTSVSKRLFRDQQFLRLRIHLEITQGGKGGKRTEIGVNSIEQREQKPQRLLLYVARKVKVIAFAAPLKSFEKIQLLAIRPADRAPQGLFS